MRIIDFKFWVPLVIWSAFMIFMIWFLLTPDRPKFIRAEDGTPCYTYKLSFSCNHEDRNFNTQFGEYPYFVEPR